MWWKNQKSIVGTKISCFALPALQLGVLRLNILAGNDFAQLMVMDSISKYITLITFDVIAIVKRLNFF